MKEYSTPCIVCDGKGTIETGWYWQQPCPICKGTGMMKITVPKNKKDE